MAAMVSPEKDNAREAEPARSGSYRKYATKGDNLEDEEKEKRTQPLGCVRFVEFGDGDDTTFPDFEIHGFVRGVDGVLLQSKAHENRFASKDGFEGCDDRNRTTTTGS